MKKLSQQQIANTLKVVLVLLWGLLMLSIVSCSSASHYNYNQAKRKADKMLYSNHKQFAVVNNQIIIFENN